MIELVVLDHDGTFTDTRDGAPGFDSAFLLELGNVLGGIDVREDYERAKDEVRAASPELAWEIAGHAVSPAAGDPFTLASEAARRVLGARGVPKAFLSDVIGELYALAYGRAPSPYRPDARAVLGVLRRRANAVFVTNASSEVVNRRLTESMFPAGLTTLSVEGDARKFVVGPSLAPDPRFDALPASTTARGLARPILLRRGRYFDVLKRLWERTGTTAETTLVCGDTWELDLAMPAALGAQVHLVLRENTYAYERAAIDALGPRGGASESLLPILTRLAG